MQRELRTIKILIIRRVALIMRHLRKIPRRSQRQRGQMKEEKPLIERRGGKLVKSEE